MEVANPIYDVVFKYLMEDVRVARTILSALLKQDVLSVEPRAHEYTGKRYCLKNQILMRTNRTF